MNLEHFGAKVKNVGALLLKEKILESQKDSKEEI